MKRFTKKTNYISLRIKKIKSILKKGLFLFTNGGDLTNPIRTPIKFFCPKNFVSTL